MISKGTIETSRHIVSYKEAGVGETTALLIHGNSLSKECFQPQLESGLTEICRLIAIDLPGHGDTVNKSDDQPGYRFPELKTFLFEAVSRLNIENCVLMGHSLGGHIAIETADKIPGVNRIVAWGTPPLTYEDVGIPPFNESPETGLIFQDDLSDNDIALLSEAYWSKLSDPHSLISENISNTDPKFRAAIAKSITNGEWEDEVKQLSSCNKPVALALGEHDKLVNRDYIQAVAVSHIWNNELQIIPDAGHSAHLENPDNFNNWVLNFFEELSN